MIDTLYIIGNGFDLHHGLRTSYTNFRDDYVCKKQRLWNSLSTIYGDHIDKEMWWWNFEEMLGQIDYLNLKNAPNGVALGASNIKNLLESEVPFFFGDWIGHVDDKANPDESLGIDNTSLFFTFNYTLLLEKVYGVSESNVWHIHRSINDIKHGNNPIVGHDSDGGQLVRYTQDYNKGNQKVSASFADTINQAAINGAKKVKDIIYLNNDRFQQYADIKHFIVMGFSLNDIDLPYIERIIKVNNMIENTDWTLYCHFEGEYENMINQLETVGIKREQILRPIKW